MKKLFLSCMGSCCDNPTPPYRKDTIIKHAENFAMIIVIEEVYGMIL
jgi:hypothetical protein